MIISQDGKVRYVNPAASAVTGLRRDELLGRPGKNARVDASEARIQLDGRPADVLMAYDVTDLKLAEDAVRSRSGGCATWSRTSSSWPCCLTPRAS